MLVISLDYSLNCTPLGPITISNHIRAIVRFRYQFYDNRPNWALRSPITIIYSDTAVIWLCIQSCTWVTRFTTKRAFLVHEIGINITVTNVAPFGTFLVFIKAKRLLTWCICENTSKTLYGEKRQQTLKESYWKSRNALKFLKMISDNSTSHLSISK